MIPAAHNGRSIGRTRGPITIPIAEMNPDAAAKNTHIPIIGAAVLVGSCASILGNSSTVSITPAISTPHRIPRNTVSILCCLRTGSNPSPYARISRRKNRVAVTTQCNFGLNTRWRLMSLQNRRPKSSRCSDTRTALSPPTEVPLAAENLTPFFTNSSTTPNWYAPLAPPPASTKPMRLDELLLNDMFNRCTRHQLLLTHSLLHSARRVASLIYGTRVTGRNDMNTSRRLNLSLSPRPDPA